MEAFEGMSSEVIEASAGALRDARREQRDFERDRFWRTGRVKYMAHAKGWVMARKRGAVPVVISEKEWRQLPYLG